MLQYILTAEHIHKKYGINTILQDVSIHIRKGEIYGLVGKNGSGKTTLLRILTGLIQNYSGTVSSDTMDNGIYQISAVIDSPSLYLNLTAFENIKVQCKLLGINNYNKIEQIIETVGLSGCGNKTVKNFSLGMTQRLKIGMAILGNPQFLVLDEPVNGLDPEGIADLRQLLVDLNRTKNITILISSHILSELEQIATCFGILHNGKIVQELTTDDISARNISLENLYMQYVRGKELC